VDALVNGDPALVLDCDGKLNSAVKLMGISLCT
jgi:hypothetical protein